MEWMTPRDVSKLVGCDPRKAREIIKKINNEYEEQGYIVPNKFKVPKQQLMKRLGLMEEE